MFSQRFFYSCEKTGRLWKNKVHFRRLDTPGTSESFTSWPSALTAIRRVSNIEYRDNPTQTAGISLFNVRKIIKSSGLEFAEGFTCIQTVCPVCQTFPECDSNSNVKRETIFINKTTGCFTCSACQYLGYWDNIEKFFLPHNKSAKTNQVMRKLKDLFVEKKNAVVQRTHELPTDLIKVDNALATDITVMLNLKV